LEFNSVNLVLRSVTIDSRDPYVLAKWWCEVFGVPMSQEDFPDDPQALCDLGADRARLLFVRVPEEKTAKNRVHIDLRPATSLQDELDRLLGLGATFVADHRNEDGGAWVVLADPEGNEFCIERALDER
jgi:predicted enzyme related to lactoylglutathione lyase